MPPAKVACWKSDCLKVLVPEPPRRVPRPKPGLYSVAMPVLLVKLYVLAVIGPAASAAVTYGGGGSAAVLPSATVSPLEHGRRLAKLLEEERDAANRTAADLRTKVEGLEARASRAAEDAKSANAEAGALMTMLEKAEAERKAALRRQVVTARAEMPPAGREAAGRAIRDHVLSLPEVAAAGTIAAYYSVGREPATARHARPAAAEAEVRNSRKAVCRQA